MNISQLEYYIAAVAEGSFVRAAKKQYVTTQAISRAVRELESEFGVSLMVREGRGVRPTPLGLLFCDQAKLVLEECGALKSIALLERNVNRAPKDISLAVSTAECRGNLYPKRLFRLGCNTGLSLHAVFGLNAYCLNLLQDGFVEMALIMGASCKDDELQYSYITSIEPQFAVSFANPLAAKGGLSAEDLNKGQVALPLDADSLAFFRRWLVASGSEVSYESVGLNIEEHKAFLEKGGVIMVLGNDQSVLPSINHIVLPQVGKTRLRFPIYACAKREFDPASFKAVCTLLKGIASKARWTRTDEVSFKKNASK